MNLTGYQSISNSSTLIFDGPIYSLNQSISPSGQNLILGCHFAILTSINPGYLNLINNLTSDPHSSPASLSHDYQSPNVLYLPSGPDGPQNSCEINISFDNGMLTLNLGKSVNAGGIRIENPFTNGGGTAGVQAPSNGLYELIPTGNGSISQESTSSNNSFSTTIDQLGVTLKPN
ncbi:hypothetical protein O181_000095 [Austropuccinia psidii MF-1]|uniref:Uncharacterized protein n=1 Tax=Austropuccinia psidii MF-1 TaxID=1389203 RepID=A0A9Q3B891_9BASI|nr:hypothetical protein [Austropuccinia psidii MF-1]